MWKEWVSETESFPSYRTLWQSENCKREDAMERPGMVVKSLLQLRVIHSLNYCVLGFLWTSLSLLKNRQLNTQTQSTLFPLNSLLIWTHIFPDKHGLTDHLSPRRTNCAFGLYPSSGVPKNWGIENIYQISQYTRPQNSHQGQLLTTEPLNWVHTHINPWSQSDTDGNKWPSHCTLHSL
jgi:hypothetical protein